MNHFTRKLRIDRRRTVPTRPGLRFPMMVMALCLVVLAAPPARADYNDVVRQDQDRLFTGFMSNYVIGMAPGLPPQISIPTNGAAWYLNIELKYVPPIVEAPPPIGFDPNNAAPGQRERCYLKERVRRGDAVYSNLRGFDKGRLPADLDWFPLTPWVAPGESIEQLRSRGPYIRHRNSDVTVQPLFSNAYIRDDFYRPVDEGTDSLRPRKRF